MTAKAETCDISWCVSLRAANSVYCPVHRNYPQYGPSRPSGPDAVQAWKLWKQLKQPLKKDAP